MEQNINRNPQSCYRQARQPYGRVPVKNMQRQQSQMFARPQPCDKPPCANPQPCASPQLHDKEQTPQVSCACGINEAADSAVCVCRSNTAENRGIQERKMPDRSMQNNAMSCRMTESVQEMGYDRRQENMHDNTMHGVNMPIGMCYVPWQKWGKVYDACSALERGTLFPDLDKPFLGGYC